MFHIPRSGFNLPNQPIREFLIALEGRADRSGVSACLRLAGLETWIESYPPENMLLAIDFAEFSSLLSALEQLYGPRVGRALARRAAASAFDQLRDDLGLTGFIARLAATFLPLQSRLRYGLPALSHMFNQYSDQITSVKEHSDHFSFIVHRCAMCWGRNSEGPACEIIIGVLEAALRWGAGEHEFDIAEQQCIATGHNVCEFMLAKQPLC